MVFRPETPPSPWRGVGWNLALFMATVVSVYLVGARMSPDGGLRLSLGLLSILVAHEMGHYVAARLYGVDATLPFFIPTPWYPTPLGWLPLSFVGTFGALIRIRSPFPHRRALFDIGIAGPLAGFVFALPVLVLGVLEARVVAPSAARGAVEFGEPLLFQWAVAWLRPEYDPQMTLLIGPLGLAAWFGLFVTALNLMPIGQLDGGHVSYALLRGRARLVSRLAFAVALVLVATRPIWLLWTVLLFALGRRPHPRTLDDGRPVGRGRVVIGLLGVAVFAVCFTPNPVIVGWPEFLGAFGELGTAILRRIGLT